MLRYLAILVMMASFFCPVFASEQLIVEPDMGRAPILSAISQAKNTIHLVMYGFTDPELMHALIDAKKHGKNVQIMLEPHPYKADDENEFSQHQFQQANILLTSTHPDMKLVHQKTLITDENHAMVMTFNFTRSSFSKERNFALILDDPKEIQEILRVFSADAQHKNISVTQSNLVWSPNNSREKILELLHSAKSNIKIYAQDISDYQTIGVLAKAARQGKKVEILLSQEKQNKPNKKLNFLRKAGVEIHFSKNYYIHAKVIIIDQQRALLGSINFTHPSLNDNRELSVITQDPNVIKTLVRTFQKDWNETKVFYQPLNDFVSLVSFGKKVSSFFAAASSGALFAD